MKPELIPATTDDYPTIQNMARFYVYDMSRYCAKAYPDWQCPANGLYECDDFKKYFTEPSRRAFLVKIGNKLAGFVLLNQICVFEPVDWNMGEFFILAEFQDSGIGKQVAKTILQRFPGKWSIGAIPENIKALTFWEKIIKEISGDNYIKSYKTSEELRTAEYPDPYPMVMMIFNTKEM